MDDVSDPNTVVSSTSCDGDLMPWKLEPLLASRWWFCATEYFLRRITLDGGFFAKTANLERVIRSELLVRVNSYGLDYKLLKECCSSRCEIEVFRHLEFCRKHVAHDFSVIFKVNSDT
ncbi:Uncharacterized protein Rs2_39929 [Raphanus sativus]|nr:Uncharacterized protein Rs2_39929 [Raphanus sativus]